MSAAAICALCGAESPKDALREALWLEPKAAARLATGHPGWKPKDGGCPACVQETLLTLLLENGEEALHESVQHHWPLDPEAALGSMPTPLRLHADPRFRGRGVTLAIVDAGFFPHPDLVRPVNRIRAWADASGEEIVSRRFPREGVPRWPGWNSQKAGQWHGVMTSVTAAGNGHLSHGFYRGLAAEADLVLVQVASDEGRIGNAAVVRALRWLESTLEEFGTRVVNLSLGGDEVDPLRGNPVDEAVAALVRRGVTVVVASGNDGVRRLVPPGTAPEAITVGGLDDEGLFDHAQQEIWHSNYGTGGDGMPKPEIVAPSLRVVAPLLPHTGTAQQAQGLFAFRAAGEVVDGKIEGEKLVSPFYKHVEGTSFAAPVVSSVVACMLEANPDLTPQRVKELLIGTAHVVPGADTARQGAGAIDAGKAIAAALASEGISPAVSGSQVTFRLHDRHAKAVHVVGSWDQWRQPGLAATQVHRGRWEATIPAPSGTQSYKFVVDGQWLADPLNPHRAHDGEGGWNSVLPG